MMFLRFVFLCVGIKRPYFYLKEKRGPFIVYVCFFIVLQPISIQGISEWKYFVEIIVAELNCSMHVWERKEQNRGCMCISVLISLTNQGIQNVMAAHMHMETLGLGISLVPK